MVIMKRFYSILRGSSAKDSTLVDDPRTIQLRADDKEAAQTPVNEMNRNDEDKPSEDAQPGVKKIEAVTLAWSKKTAFAVLVLYIFSFNPNLRELANMAPTQNLVSHTG